MNRHQVGLLTISILSILTGPILAQDEDRVRQRARQTRERLLDNLFRVPQGLELTDEQKTKLAFLFSNLNESGRFRVARDFKFLSASRASTGPV